MYCPCCGNVIIVDRVYPYVEVKYKPKYEESISWIQTVCINGEMD